MERELPAHKPQDAEWSREMRGKRQLTSIGLTNWVVVFPKKETLHAKNLVSALQKCCPQMGMMVKDLHMERCFRTLDFIVLIEKQKFKYRRFILLGRRTENALLE